MEAAVAARDASLLAVLVRAQLGGDGGAAAGLLRAAAAAADEPPAPRPAGAASAAAALEAPPGGELLVLQGLSLSVPRGRFDVALGTAERWVSACRKGQGTKCLAVPWTDITHLVKLAKPTPYSKGAEATAWNLVLPLRAPLEVGKQSMRCVVLNASSASRPPSSGSSKAAVCKGEEADTEAGHRAARLESALAAATPDEPEHRFLTRLLAAATDLAVHESEECVCPVEFVKAYRGVDDGQLYPLRAGLCFLTRPARTLFLPAQDIASIECSSRAASTADLAVSCGGTSEVFSNIANDDLLLSEARLWRRAGTALRRPAVGRRTRRRTRTTSQRRA
ncbi:unnamed protein product [Prorocentrum cordatum]|uniref:Histone chaperone RTT106/FACT complex subunit SPT16-like middle domain-containing protein n=1 Tax=Prorocentrum cordatum TaxID=2364126 RepID=A0ABN9R1U1_9DINO|nr:unnamed protein product [Polarella glacialis]